MSDGALPRAAGAVVVGAGVAGLAAACVLARNGVRTTLLEGGKEPGGLCRTVRRGALRWSLALYSLRGAAARGPMSGLLRELGIAERLTLRHTTRAYRVLLGGEQFVLGTDDEEACAGAERLAPGSADGLRRLLARIRGFDPVRDYAALRRSTFAEVITGFVPSPRLRAAFCAPLMISLGLPPERASAYFCFLKYRLILEGGLSWPEGGAEALVEALVGRFLADGGDLRLGQLVAGVALGSGGGKIVTCDSGETCSSDRLILACDATTALGWLAPHLPRQIAKAQRLKPALPAELLLLEGPASTLARTGLDEAAHLVALGDDDLAGSYARLRQGDAAACGRVAGLTSPSTWGGVNETGRVAFTGFFLAPEGARETSLTELTERLRQSFGTAFEGLEPVAAIGPEALRSLALNRDGAFCGWEMGPERYGPERIPSALPVPGVWLAGHWTDPGPSVLNAMLSGATAAKRALGR